MENFFSYGNEWNSETNLINPEQPGEWAKFWARLDAEDEWERKKTQGRQTTLLSPAKDFSPEFLSKHHDLVLYDVFHQIRALILFPLNCSCHDSCDCSEWREKVVLALNTHRYR